MTDFPDWAALLPSSGALLTLADDPDFHWQRPSTVRGLFVRLRDVAEALPTREFADDAVAVHADVLRLDAPLELRAAQVTLHARRIEIGAGAALRIGAADGQIAACRIEIMAGEWAFADPAQHLALHVGPVLHRIESDMACGLLARIEANGNCEIAERSDDQPGDALTGQLQIGTARQLASGLAPDAPDAPFSRELALRLLDWVARTGATPTLRGQARADAAHLRTPRAHAHFVPYLRQEQYRSLAQATLTALQGVEAEYRTLFDRTLDIDAQKRAALAMLEHYRNAKGYSDRLLAQAADDVAQAAGATVLAQQKMDERRAALDEKKRALDAGVEAKRREHQRQAAFNIITGVVLMGAGIATVWFSGPAGAGAAAAGAAQVGKAAADTAVKVGKLVELIQKIAKVLDAIKKIQGYIEQLRKAYAAVADPLEAARRAEAAGRAAPDPLARADLMGAADWDEFVVDLDAAFAPVLGEKVAGAADYLAEMKKLAIRGKDWVATHANLERSQQVFEQRLWQRLRDEHDIADMQQRIESLDNRHGPGSVLMAYHAQLRDLLKARLIQAIQDQGDAYRYYALRQPRLAPGLAASAADLAKSLADLQQDLVDAKTSRGPISTWGPERQLLPDTALLQTLQHTRSLSWVVDTGSFAGMDRVRVRELQVWLNGEALGTGKFHVVIQTPGDYADRLRDEHFEFATFPLQRAFRYELDPAGEQRDAWGRAARITLRADDAEGDYFEPSAFTTWIISLPQSLNPGLDAARISGVALDFFGTVIAAAPRLRGAAGAPPVLLSKVIVL